MFKSHCNKRRKVSQDHVWVNFVLLSLKFAKKEYFLLKYRDFSVLRIHVTFAIILLFSVNPV